MSISSRLCGGLLSVLLLAVASGCTSVDRDRSKWADPTPSQVAPDWSFVETICDRLNDRSAVSALLPGRELRRSEDWKATGAVTCLQRVVGDTPPDAKFLTLEIVVKGFQARMAPEDALREAREKLRDEHYEELGPCVPEVDCWLRRSAVRQPAEARAFYFPYIIEIRLAGFAGDGKEGRLDKNSENSLILLKEAALLLKR